MSNVSRHNLDSPSVQHIAYVLEQKILSGEYKSGQWLPSERALAEEFQVSRVIIRDAVKMIEDRELVVRSARCRPVVRGASLSPVVAAPTFVKRRTIALLIWPGANWPASANIVQGIRQTLNQDDFRLVLETAIGDTIPEQLASEGRFLERLYQDEDVEGLILWHLGGESNLAALGAVRAAGIPMVFLDRRPPVGFEADYVGVDNTGAAEKVVRHLLAQGHRTIAHVTNFDTASTVGERLQGYKRALQRAGLPVRPELIPRDPGPVVDDEHGTGCEPLIEKLLGLPDPPTALFAVNDLVASRLVTTLKARGVRVPEDIAVAGFDGIERWGHGAPFLTAVHQPFERIGAQAAELLLERIEQGASAPPFRHVLLDAPLIVRGSTRIHRTAQSSAQA